MELNENTIKKIVAETLVNLLKEDDSFMPSSDNFSKAMDELYNLVGDCVGGEEIRTTIASYFWKDWDGEQMPVPCEYDASGMSELLWDLCNFDLIFLNDDGTVNIEDSNHPDIARLVEPYVSVEDGLRLVKNLYGRGELNENYMSELSATPKLRDNLDEWGSDVSYSINYFENHGYTITPIGKRIIRDLLAGYGLDEVRNNPEQFLLKNVFDYMTSECKEDFYKE